MRTWSEHKRPALALAAVVLAALALPAPAPARSTRVFAVGPRISLDWVESGAAYRAKLSALVDRRLRGRPGVPAIQRGADDVASHLRRDGRNLVVLPEDVGLPAVLVGPRGAAARAVAPGPDAAVTAIASLLGPYAGPVAHYQRRFPSLGPRGLPARALTLALTDTVGRTAVETFAALARRHRVWLEAGVNMARDWRIVCRDRRRFRPLPGAERCDAEDPARVTALGDPGEPGRGYAYEATGSATANMALLFDPRGRLRAKVEKAYLTPIELPGNLDLRPGAVDGVRAVRTPVGTLGFVTSKDAWMPDVTAKLDARGVDLLVQPEFFVGDTLSTRGQWALDVLKSSGWADVMRHPSIDAMVMPELTGNFFSFGADAQQHIVVKPRGRRFPRGFLAGQPPAPGFLRVAPYVVPDPVRLPLAERRRRLGRAGEALAFDGPPCRRPDVAAACAGSGRETVTWADVEVGAPRPRRPRRPRDPAGPFGPARAISPSRFEQRNADLASWGRTVVAAFEERGRVFVVASRDGGRTWGRRTSPYRGHGPRQWWPQVALGPEGRMWLVWQERRVGRWLIRFAQGRVGARLTQSRPLAPARGPQWRPTVAATGRATAYAAWIDERERSADDARPQAHVYGAPLGLNPVPGRARRLDAGRPVELARKLDHSWAPDLAARGRRLALTWVDFRTYGWRVYLRESRDAGANWGRERDLVDLPPGLEPLNDTPRAAVTRSGPLVAWTDWRGQPASARRPHSLYDIAAARPGGRNARVDRGGPAQSVAFSPAVLPAGRGALVAWQDMRAGPGRILLAPVDSRGRPSGPQRRVDDGGGAGINAWRPALAAAGRGRVLAAWESERDGPAQILAATASAARLRGR